jgi:acyl-CoA dehydrogenase
VQFKLTDIRMDIQNASREFVEQEFELDLALELEKEGRFPKSIFEKACHLGFIGIEYPEQYGSQSLGHFENVLAVEESTGKGSGIGISLSLADMGPILFSSTVMNVKRKSSWFNEGTFH